MKIQTFSLLKMHSFSGFNEYLLAATYGAKYLLVGTSTKFLLYTSHPVFLYFSAQKGQNAASRFFIERIGLKENNFPKVLSQMGHKRAPMEKRRRLHSKIKHHMKTSSNHLGVKRQFGAQNLLPRPFDGPSVKGKVLANHVWFAKSAITCSSV